MDLKEKVLQGIMEYCDELEGEGLKKHPKVLARMPKEEISVEAEVESEDEVDPEMLAKLMEMIK